MNENKVIKKSSVAYVLTERGEQELKNWQASLSTAPGGFYKLLMLSLRDLVMKIFLIEKKYSARTTPEQRLLSAQRTLINQVMNFAII